MIDRDPRRKPHRLPLSHYRGPNCYFVTICCHQRRRLFTNCNLVDELRTVLNDSCAAHLFKVDAYCFMPDHFHALLAGMSQSANLLAAVRSFKGASTARARSLTIAPLWQKGFYDHLIRAEESLNRITWYILMNPVRDGLVSTASEWPFSDWSMPDWRSKLAPAESYVPPWKTRMPGPNHRL